LRGGVARKPRPRCDHHAGEPQLPEPRVTAQRASHDIFQPIRAATDTHRARHGCGAYPYANGPLLGVLAASVGARRILELGCALGYTALWLAHGAPEAIVDTIERDSDHVRLARKHIESRGMTARIAVHEGEFEKVLGTLEPAYDVAFFDG